MKIIQYVLLFLVVQQLQAQNSIKGKIMDQQSNSIPYASAYLPQLEKGALSDENGTFVIEGVPLGDYKLIISILGYNSQSLVVNVPLEKPLEIVLEASAIEMQEVIISTPFHKLQKDNVMKVERQSMNELNKQGGVNLSQGITNISGVQSISTGLSVGKPVIRGLSSNRVLVYTQGIRLENQQFGDEHGLGINASGIESVEVIKGPSSLLYGSDALGGVLYLNPERFAMENSTEVSMDGTYFGNTNGFTTSAGVKTSGEHFKALVRAAISQHSDYESKDYSVTNSRFKEKDLKAAIGYQRNKFKTELRYNYFQSDLGLPEGIGEQTNDKTPQLPYQDLENHILSSKSSIFFNKSSLDVTLGYIANDRKEFEEHHEHEEEEEGVHEEEEEEEGPALFMKLNTLNYDIKYNFPTIGKFETIVGIQGMYQTNENFGEEQLIPDANTFDVGLLATSHIHFEALDIQLGARYDRRKIEVNDGIEREFNSFNAALGFKVEYLKNITTRFNLASGFRAPNLAELTSDGTHEGTNRYEIGNPDLNNEQNYQLDLSTEYSNEHIELFANVFYNRVMDYIYLNPNGEFIDEDPVFLYEQIDAKLYGGEFGLHFHPHPLDWLHVESSYETVLAERDDDEYLPLIPANSWTNTLRVEFNGKSFRETYGYLKMQSVFEQDRVSEFETTTGAYNLLSMGFGTTVQLFNNDLSLSITATNLTDKRFINHLSRLKSDGILNMGRNISFGLSYSI